MRSYSFGVTNHSDGIAGSGTPCQSRKRALGVCVHIALCGQYVCIFIDHVDLDKRYTSFSKRICRKTYNYKNIYIIDGGNTIISGGVSK